MRSIHKYSSTKYLWLLAVLLVTLTTCTSRQGGGGYSLTEAERQGEKGDAEPFSCTELLRLFNEQLDASQACTNDAECAYFDVCAAGCWRLYNRKFHARLLELSRPLEQPRCRVFLPMYKCDLKPGEPVCDQGRCQWQKRAAQS